MNGKVAKFLRKYSLSREYQRLTDRQQSSIKKRSWKSLSHIEKGKVRLSSKNGLTQVIKR